MASRMPRSERLTRAMALRDGAVDVVKRLGTWESVAPTKVLIARIGSLQIVYRTPFQRLHAVADRMKYNAAILGSKGNLPYGLEVWAPKKVLGIEWDNQGNVELFNF